MNDTSTAPVNFEVDIKSFDGGTTEYLRLKCPSCSKDIIAPLIKTKPTPTESRTTKLSDVDLRLKWLLHLSRMHKDEMLAMMIFRDQTAFTDSLEALAAKLQGVLRGRGCPVSSALLPNKLSLESWLEVARKERDRVTKHRQHARHIAESSTSRLGGAAPNPVRPIWPSEPKGETAEAVTTNTQHSLTATQQSSITDATFSISVGNATNIQVFLLWKPSEKMLYYSKGNEWVKAEQNSAMTKFYFKDVHNRRYLWHGFIPYKEAYYQYKPDKLGGTTYKMVQIKDKRYAFNHNMEIYEWDRVIVSPC